MAAKRARNSRNATSIAPWVMDLARYMLNLQWSPVQIAGKLLISHEALYLRIYTEKAQGGHALLQGEEAVVFTDAGYQGTGKSPEATGVDWQVAMRPDKRKAQKQAPWEALVEKAEKLKVSVRAKMEHPFRVLKCQFGFTKLRYKSLAKNTAQLMTLFALSNLWVARMQLMGMRG